MRLGMPRNCGVRTACYMCCVVRGYYAAVGSLISRREQKKAVGKYCGSKDRRLLETEQKVAMSRASHESPAGIEKEVVSCEITS